jgi:isopentenyl-diphosphate delta-isomerase type 1
MSNVLVEYVILVDEQDQALGQAEKMLAHQEAWCHRAFSVFVFRKVSNKQGDLKIEFLLQQRHASKYHCGGLWTNTCCSHPRPSEDIIQAGQRRLKEEMGLDLPLIAVGAFHYVAAFENGLTENEYDHVLLGEWAGTKFQVDSLEIQDYRWMSIEAIEAQLKVQGEAYTPWFKPALQLAIKGVQKWISEENAP